MNCNFEESEFPRYFVIDWVKAFKMNNTAVTLKADKAERLTQLKKDSEEAEALKSEKEAIKKDAEDKESAALKVYREAEELEKQQKADHQKEENEKEAKTMFTAFDSNTDGRYILDMEFDKFDAGSGLFSSAILFD